MRDPIVTQDWNVRRIQGGMLLLLSVAFAAPLKIAFGSCAHQDKAQPIWRSVIAVEPDVFVFLGDNVYGDTTDMPLLQSKYEELGDKAGFQELRKRTRVIATWDDHDYGKNDAGKEYPKRRQSELIFERFWQVPRAVAEREGVYGAYRFGDVQVLLLDLRSFRDPLLKGPRTAAMKARHQGPYKQKSAGSMLGADQWAWLEAKLKEPATLRVIGASTQVLPEGGGWEAWTNLPAERTRLLELLKKAGRTVIISGDTHWAELSQDEGLTELTSSGLTQVWKGVGPNDNRVGEAVLEANFGLLTIDGDTVTMEIRDVDGTVKLSHSLD